MKAFTFGGKKPKAPCSIKAASSADAEDAVPFQPVGVLF